MFWNYHKHLIENEDDTWWDYQQIPLINKFDGIDFIDFRFNLNVIANFVHFNFGGDQYFNYDYFYWMFGYCNRNVITGLKIGKYLCGIFTARPIKLIYENKIRDTYFIDFLTTHRNMRNKNITPNLLWKITNEWRKNNMDLIVFNIEKPNKIPIKSASELQFYSCPLNEWKHNGKSNFKVLNFNNLNDTFEWYKFYNSFVKKNAKIFQHFDYDEFCYYFNRDGLIYTLVDNSPPCLTVVQMNRYKKGIVPEILFFGSPRPKISFMRLMDTFSKHFTNVIFNNSISKNIIKELKKDIYIKKTNESGFYFYGANLKFKPHQIIIPIS